VNRPFAFESNLELNQALLFEFESYVGPKCITPVSPWQVRNRLVRAKVNCVCCVVNFPKFHYNDLLPTCCRLVGCVANKSATSWQLPQLQGSYGETCVMHFGQYHSTTVQRSRFLFHLFSLCTAVVLAKVLCRTTVSSYQSSNTLNNTGV